MYNPSVHTCNILVFFPRPLQISGIIYRRSCKNFPIGSFRSFSPGARHNRKCEGLSVCVCSCCMSSNSVQSFMIDICNGPPIENGLHDVCLAPAVPFLTFTDYHKIKVFICGLKSLFFKANIVKAVLRKFFFRCKFSFCLKIFSINEKPNFVALLLLPALLPFRVVLWRVCI